MKHEILSAGQPVLASPPEGLWSVACGWREGWPGDWHHANPFQHVSAGEWTVLKGEGNACGGAWLIEDAYRSQGRALKVTLSVRFQAASDRASGKRCSENVFALRGSYNEQWTVFWITADFLNAVARFLELGVPVWR